MILIIAVNHGPNPSENTFNELKSPPTFETANLKKLSWLVLIDSLPMIEILLPNMYIKRTNIVKIILLCKILKSLFLNIFST